MDFNSTEEQQLETLKRWWAEYGKSIILGAVVGLGGLFGWRYYQEHQVTTQAAGAESFAAISEKLATDGPDAFSDAAAFVEQNQGNNYGELTALLLAGEAAKANQLPLAQQQLELALANTKDAALSDTIRLRLARVLLAQDKPADAQAQLNDVKQAAFSALRSEVQGDVYTTQGNTDEAYQAYQAAAEAGGLNNNPALKLKLDNLAINPALEVAAPAAESTQLPAQDTAEQPVENAVATPAENAPAENAVATPVENAVATPADNAVTTSKETAPVADTLDTPAKSDEA